MMRDPIWFKEFEREYNEREDRIAELKEKHEQWQKELKEKEKKKDGMD
jgi:hypothetical protein